MTVLGSVSLFASYIGSCITAKWLRTISALSGIVFICFGGYLLTLFFLEATNLVNTSFFF